MRPVNLHYNPTSNFNIFNINPADLVFPHLNKCDDIQLQELFCWHIVKDFYKVGSLNSNVGRSKLWQFHCQTDNKMSVSDESLEIAVP